jgi:hypothetical protein
MKFGLCEVKLHGHWEIVEFNLGVSPLTVSLNKNMLTKFVFFFPELLSDIEERLL